MREKNVYIKQVNDVRNTICGQNIPSNNEFSMTVDAEQVSPDGPAIIPGFKPGFFICSRACEKLPKCNDYVGLI